MIAAAAETQSTATWGQAAAGHGAALFQQFTVEGDGAAAAELLTGTAEIAEHQRVPEDVGKHLVVDGLKPHQVHGAAHQAIAVLASAGAGPPGEGGTAVATAWGADLVEGQEGEPAGAAAFEQRDGLGGDAVVIDHHLAETGAGGHFQGESVRVLHLPQLRHRAMNAVEAGLQQQAQGAGAAALLQRIAAAFQPSDLPLQPGLLLLQSRSGALLDRQGVCGLLQRLLSGREALEQGLPVLLQLLQALLHRLLVVAVLLLLLLQFRQPFRVLPQPLLQLLLFLQQRCQGDLQLLATAAASFLLLKPGTGAAGDITEAPPGHLHRCFRPPTGGLGSSQSVLMGILLKLA